MDNCAHCGKVANSKCTNCKAVQYCSRDCQKAHWKSHKLNCRPFEVRKAIENLLRILTLNGIFHSCRSRKMRSWEDFWERIAISPHAQSYSPSCLVLSVRNGTAKMKIPTRSRFLASAALSRLKSFASSARVACGRRVHLNVSAW